jgi:hypothetical protein
MMKAKRRLAGHEDINQGGAGLELEIKSRNREPRSTQSGGAATKVAQVSNLLYRRFPIGRPYELPNPFNLHTAGRLEALRHSRLETCATGLSARPGV